MARISWQEAIKRFTHIDAELVACEIGLPQHDGFFTVSLYPWWEHPKYLEAREESNTWGFAGGADGNLDVIVYPQWVRKFQLSRDYSLHDVQDWDFTQEHPLLWQYEQQGTITCNQSLTLEQWMQIAALTKNKLTDYNHEADVVGYGVERVYRFGHTTSFSLGDFPATPFHALCGVLDEQSIRYFALPGPERRNLPVLFLINGEDYIIADDFEVDVPEFVHKPEWFQPR